MLTKYDIIVAGGGVSGVAAAVAASRCGSSVLLIEKNFFLGGAATASLVAPFQTFHSKEGQVIRGFAQELVDTLVACGASLGHLPDPVGFVETVTPFDSEILKIVLLNFINNNNTDVIFGVEVSNIGLDDENNIVYIDIKAGTGPCLNHTAAYLAPTLTGHTPATRIYGKVFVDATGNGDITFLSGAKMEIDKDCQPMSLLFKIGGVNAEEIISYQKKHPEEFHISPDISVIDRGYIGVSGFFSEVKKVREQEQLSVPRDRLLFFGTTKKDEVLVNTTRMIGYNGLNHEDISKATCEGFKQIQELFSFMKNKIPGFKNSYILQIASQVGVRETRRLIGKYVLNENEITSSTKFPDVIAKGAFPLDVHLAKQDGILTKQIEAGGHYDIPLRCLVTDEMRNLVVVGKCISVTHLGFSSSRVMPTCMAVGQAGGVAASFIAKFENTQPEDMTEQIQQTLIKQKAILKI